MPWHIEKAGAGQAYVVNDETGKKMSNHPIPTRRASAQLKALYANVPDAKEVSATPSAVMAHGEGGLFSQAGLGGAKEEEKPKKKPSKKVSKDVGTLQIFKEKSGKYRWVTLSSNSFQDYDKEIVSQKALENDVERADRDKVYGPLRWWHVDGLDIGDCDFNMVEGRMLIESGTFKNEKVALAMKEHAPDLQVSIGFYHPADEPDGDGTFHTIRRFERSILPAGTASNKLTKFIVKGDETMATKEEKETALRELLGDPQVADAVINTARLTEKSAFEEGLAFKEIADDIINTQAELSAEKGKITHRKITEEHIEDNNPPKETAPLAVHQPEAQATEQAPAVAQPVQAQAQPAEAVLKPEAEEAPVEQEQVVAEAGAQVKPAPRPAPTAPAPRPVAQAAPAKPAPAPAPAPKAEEAPAEEEGEYPEVIGNMTMEEFADLLSDALANALEPYLAQQKEMGSTVKELQTSLLARTKEQDTSKDVIEKLVIRVQNAELALKEASRKVTELEGSAPKAVKEGFFASQSDETKLSKEQADAAMSKAGLQQDDFGDFFKFAISNSQ